MLEKLQNETAMQPLQNNESFEEQDIPLTSEESARYTGMISKSLDITADEIKTVGELEGASEYVSGLLQDRFIEDKLDVAEFMIARGLMTPEDAQRLLRTEPFKTSRPLEAYLALHGVDRTMTDDDTQGSALVNKPALKDDFMRVTTNRQVVESVKADLRNQYNKFAPSRIFTTIFTPAEWYRRAKATPTDAKYISNIRKEESHLIRKNIYSLPVSQFADWIQKYSQEYIARGGSPDTLADSLEEALTFSDDYHWDAIGLALDAGLPVGMAAKGATAGAKTGIKAGIRKGVSMAAQKNLTKLERAQLVSREAAKGAIKGAVISGATMGIGEVIPFADAALRQGGRIVSSVGSTVTNELKYYKNFLNRRAADATLASKIEKGKVVFENPDIARYIVEENLDSAVTPRVVIENTASINRMSLTEDANRYSKALSKVVSQLDEHGYTLQGLEEEALTNALDNKLRQWQVDNPDLSANIAEVVDVNFIDMADGHLNARMIIGTGAGLHSPFTNEKAAEELANTLKRKGLGNSRVVNDGAGYWVWTDVNLQKSRGVIVDEFLQPTSGNNGSFQGGLWGYITQRASTPASIMNLNNITMKTQNDLQNMLKNVRKSYDSLHKAEKADLDFLVEQSRIKEAFITETAMREAGYTEAVINAYQNMRLVHDTAWIARQRALIQTMEEQGLKRITVYPDKQASEGIVTGRLIRPDSFTEDRYFFIEEPGADRTPFKLTREQFNNRYAKDYDIVEYIHMTDGIPAQKAYHLVPKKTIRVQDLDKNFASYVPGFSHIYDNNAIYIKQLKVSRLPDGEEIVGDISTIFGETNIKLGRDYAIELEKIRKAVADFESGSPRFTSRAALDDFVASNSPLGRWASSKDFKDFAAKNNISLNPKDTIEAVRQGQTLKALNLYKNSIDEDMIKALDASDSFNFALRKVSGLNEGKINRAARKTTYERPLTGINGDRTPYIDARTEIQHWIRNIENVTTMDEYSRIFADAYAKTFKEVIAPNQTPIRALRTGALVGKTEQNAHLIDAARKAKRTHDYIRGIMTDADVTVANFLTRVLDGLGERLDFLKDLPLVGDAFVSGTNLQRSIATLAPVKYMRWYVSQVFLGLCNPRQLFTQALAVHNTIAISPVAGTKAIPFAFIMGPLLAKRNKAALIAAQKTLTKAGVEEVTTSWLSNFIEAANKLDVYGRTAQGGAIDIAQEAVSTKLDKYSMAFFQGGEAYNRYHSASTVLFEELAKGSSIEDLAKMSRQTQARLLSRQNDLYMNMNKTGVAPIQQGTLLSLGLQMKGFLLRYMESFFNKNLTKAERLRLGLMDVLLTGFGGWTGINTYRWWSSEEEMEPATSFAAQAFEEGLINAVTSTYFKNRLDIAELMSPQMLDPIVSLFEMDTGTIPFSTAFKKGGKGADIVFNHFQTYKYGPLSAEGLKQLTQRLAVQRALPSGAQNIILGWMIAETGNLYASSGQLTAKDLGNVEAVATALGFKLMDEAKLYKLNSIKYDQRERANEAFKFLRPFFNEMTRNSTPSTREQFRITMAMAFERFGITNIIEKKEVFERLIRDGRTAHRPEYENLILDIARDSGIEKAKAIEINFGR